MGRPLRLQSTLAVLSGAFPGICIGGFGYSVTYGVCSFATLQGKLAMICDCALHWGCIGNQKLRLHTSRGVRTYSDPLDSPSLASHITSRLAITMNITKSINRAGAGDAESR